MGSAESVTHVKDEATGELKLVRNGPTESQVKKAKALGKDVSKLTKHEKETPLSDLLKRN